jgi:hypothetical protein
MHAQQPMQPSQFSVTKSPESSSFAFIGMPAFLDYRVAFAIAIPKSSGSFRGISLGDARIRPACHRNCQFFWTCHLRREGDKCRYRFPCFSDNCWNHSHPLQISARTEILSQCNRVGLVAAKVVGEIQKSRTEAPTNGEMATCDSKWVLITHLTILISNPPAGFRSLHRVCTAPPPGSVDWIIASEPNLANWTCTALSTFQRGR